jgi:hypothetical protein
MRFAFEGEGDRMSARIEPVGSGARKKEVWSLCWPPG